MRKYSVYLGCLFSLAMQVDNALAAYGGIEVSPGLSGMLGAIKYLALFIAAFAIWAIYKLITRSSSFVYKKSKGKIDSIISERTVDTSYYAIAEHEIDEENVDAGLWAKALVNAKGNEDVRNAEYIKLRAKELQSADQAKQKIEKEEARRRQQIKVGETKKQKKEQQEMLKKTETNWAKQKWQQEENAIQTKEEYIEMRTGQLQKNYEQELLKEENADNQLQGIKINDEFNRKIVLILELDRIIQNERILAELRADYFYRIISAETHRHDRQTYEAKRIISLLSELENKKPDALFGERLSDINSVIKEFLNGIKKEYYQNRKLKAEIPIKNGKKEGIVKYYYENGRLERETSYKTGKREGIDKIYYNNGNLKSEYSLKEEKREGVVKLYREDGSLSQDISYKNNLRAGFLQLYRKNGELLAKITYANDSPTNGICYHADGTTRTLTNAELENWENGFEFECD